MKLFGLLIIACVGSLARHHAHARRLRCSGTGGTLFSEANSSLSCMQAGDIGPRTHVARRLERPDMKPTPQGWRASVCIRDNSVGGEQVGGDIGASRPRSEVCVPATLSTQEPHHGHD